MSLLTLEWLRPGLAEADEFEAQWSARPWAGVARLREEGAASLALATQGGLSLGLSYGLSNRLDLCAELSLASSAMTRFADVMVSIDGGSAQRGELQRRSGGAQLAVGPIWRLGVAWVPVLAVTGGAGVRYRSDGELVGTGIVPASKRAEQGLELVVATRLGLERRVSPRFTVGVYASAQLGGGPALPLQASLSGSFGVSYVYYPQW
ncbi:MAG TPA: hypothetical protein PKU97_17725 [Kofleriaceae bacterium]|nr:hypothetical protein [Kofleriaceae bacterium]